MSRIYLVGKFGEGPSNLLHQREYHLSVWLSQSIITGNARDLNNDIVDALCVQFIIHYQNSTPYRPKMNAAIEATNKNMKKIYKR